MVPEEMMTTIVYVEKRRKGRGNTIATSLFPGGLFVSHYALALLELTM